MQESTPLHIAATYNHFEVARVLLEEGANPRSVDGDRRTPLHEACLEGNDKIVGLLLQEGKDRFGDEYATAVSWGRAARLPFFFNLAKNLVMKIREV